MTALTREEANNTEIGSRLDDAQKYCYYASRNHRGDKSKKVAAEAASWNLDFEMRHTNKLTYKIRHNMYMVAFENQDLHKRR